MQAGRCLGGAGERRENLFFIDVQARGAYPAYSARVFREKGVTIDKAPGDDEILKNTVDFVSFSYSRLALRLGGDEITD
ncbi:hypothetical protein SU67_24985 [Escherichia coli O139:H28 str. E24377A]|nr:hypothetical protein SU67_24985 [Escherichia coli O139:H28 str. E24377A]